MEDANVKDLTNEQDQENEEHEEVVTTRVQHFGGNTDPFADTDEVGTMNTISSEEYSGEDEVWSTQQPANC
jgi:ferritin-like protein